MNTKVYERVFCVLIALATTSCGTALLREELAPRPADRVATRVGLFAAARGFCGDPVPLDLLVPPVDSLARPEGGEVIAGFNNVLIRGADPFPCHRQRSQEYTGAVHFDLSDVRGTIIDSATLRLEHRNTSIPWRPGGYDCGIAVAPATEDWEAGYLSGPGGLTIPGVPFVRDSHNYNRILGSRGFIPETGDMSFTSPEITRIVQTWANGRPNFGFVIHSEGYLFADYVGANDLSCTNYFVATLQMSIRRFVPIVPVEPIGP